MNLPLQNNAGRLTTAVLQTLTFELSKIISILKLKFREAFHIYKHHKIFKNRAY